MREASERSNMPMGLCRASRTYRSWTVRTVVPFNAAGALLPGRPTERDVNWMYTGNLPPVLFIYFYCTLHVESPIIPTGLMNEVAEDPSSRSKHPHLSSLANYRSHPSSLDSRGHVSLTLSSSRSRLLPGPPPISVGAPASIATSLVLIQAIVFDSALPFRNMSAWANQSSGTIVFACPMDGQFLTTAQDVDSRVVLIRG